MDFRVILPYSSFFTSQDKPRFDYFQDLPTIFLLKLLSMMNALLYLREGEIKVQLKILNTILQKQPQKLKDEIISTYDSEIKKRPKNHVVIFARQVNLEFISSVLTLKKKQGRISRNFC